MQSAAEKAITKRIYSATVAIGWLKPNANWAQAGLNDEIGKLMAGKPCTLPFSIAGTGFVAAPHVVVTAGHVLRQLTYKYGIADEDIVIISIAHVKDGLYDCDVRRRFAFYRVTPKHPDGTTGVPSVDAAPVEPDADFAALRLGQGTPFEHVRPLTFAPEDNVYVGDRVSICGYFLGNRALLLGGDTGIQRIGPMLMSGKVAAIAPLGLAASGKSRSYLIDATAARGLSGAPVCNAMGDVIGMVTSGIEAIPSKAQSPESTDQIPKTVDGQGLEMLPMNLAKALPLSRTRELVKLIDQIEAHRPS